MDEAGLEEQIVILRDFDLIQDEAYIYASWRNSSYYSALVRPIIAPQSYFRLKTRQIRNILETAQVKIACFKDTPIVIAGYCVYTGDHLDWIFVKPDYRLKGIGALLFPKNIKTVTNDLTKIGQVLVDKKKLITQGEYNGRITSKQDNQASQEI